MGSEAVIVAEAAGEAYELGKFAGTWINEDFSWERCDLETMTKRVCDALGADDDPEGWKAEGVRAEPLAYCKATAAAIFAFCEKHDWKIQCVGDQHPLYERRRWRVVGNRYDDGESAR